MVFSITDSDREALRGQGIVVGERIGADSVYGAIHRATDNGKAVVVKVQRTNKSADMEIKVLYKLNDIPAIAAPRIYKDGRYGNRTWFTMSDVGKDLGAAPLGNVLFALRKTGMIDTLGGALAIQYVYAVARLHDAGIVHGDMHAQNVWFSPSKGIVFLDFGQSVLADPARLNGPFMNFPFFQKDYKLSRRTAGGMPVFAAKNGVDDRVFTSDSDRMIRAFAQHKLTKAAILQACSTAEEVATVMMFLYPHTVVSETVLAGKGVTRAPALKFIAERRRRASAPGAHLLKVTYDMYRELHGRARPRTFSNKVYEKYMRPNARPAPARPAPARRGIAFRVLDPSALPPLYSGTIATIESTRTPPRAPARPARSPTLGALKAEAKALGVRGYSRMKAAQKSELKRMIQRAKNARR